MTRVTKRFAARAGLIVLTVFSAGGFTPLVMSGQPDDSTAKQVAATVLPLPESMRAGATVVSHGEGGKFTVLRKGSNEMVCIHEPEEGQGRGYRPGEQTFWAHCFHESIFAVMKRGAELRQELLRAGKTADLKMVDGALDSEIKAGKLKLPAHPTMGFQMRGPLSGYNQATNSVSPAIHTWQMVIIPYSTGASLSLPEERTVGMPWVMDSGTWVAHIMIEGPTHQ